MSSFAGMHFNFIGPTSLVEDATFITISSDVVLHRRRRAQLLYKRELNFHEMFRERFTLQYCFVDLI